MARERTRDGRRREAHATAADRLVAKLAAQRGACLTGGDVARMPAEERRRLLMRLGFLSGRASSDELRAALDGTERTAGSRDRDREPDETRVSPLNEAGPLRDRKAIDRDEPERRGPGAPRRASTGEARDIVLPVRVSASERAAYERAAEDAGVSLSEWIRQRLATK